MTNASTVAAPWAVPTDDDLVAMPRLSRIEHAPSEISPEAHCAFLRLGLDLAHRTAADDAALARAGELICRLPDLWDVVSRRVNCVALLQSSDNCFDVSHSDPAWPGLILVSVPPATPVGELRLAEGIIHEAMHHHLSALEKTTLLVVPEARSFSPWKGCERPASGVLHSLYVFGCIAFALRRLADAGSLEVRQTVHARRRICEIGDEFGLVDHGELLEVLTVAGRRVHTQAVYALRSASWGKG